MIGLEFDAPGEAAPYEAATCVAVDEVAGGVGYAGAAHAAGEVSVEGGGYVGDDLVVGGPLWGQAQPPSGSGVRVMVGRRVVSRLLTVTSRTMPVS